MKTLFVIALTALFMPHAAFPVMASDSPWPDIRQELFGDKPINESSPPLSLYAPAQAADASIVPIDVRFPAAAVSKVKSMHLIVDRNPAPLAATFTFTDAYRDLNVGERMLAMRIRVDSFSQVRAILETTDGKLHMASKFVAGAGGCSTPASKDPDEALASMGRVKVKTKASEIHGQNWRSGQIMIQHPNFTGMQRDQKTGDYTPARFVDRIEVRSGDNLLFTMTGGISISENPNLRFTYGLAAVANQLSVRAKDTEDEEFAGSETKGGS